MSLFSIFSSFSSLFYSDNNNGFITNVDGTPMIPNASIDVHGNAYGVIDSFNNSSSVFDSSNSFSSFNSFDS